MKSVQLGYTTEDGEETFDFCLEERSSNEWRIYILEQPPYGSSPQDLKSTHRQYDSKGKYIDWSYPPDSFEHAKVIASLWAEFTHELVKSEPRKKNNHKKGYNYEYDPEDPCAPDAPPGSLEGDLHDWLTGIEGSKSSRRR